MKSFIVWILISTTLPAGSLGLAPSFDTTTAAQQQHLQTFLDGQGATRFCEIGQTTYGRGLVATCDLEPGAMALQIPLSCALLETDPDKDEDSWTGRLANRLLLQSQEESSVYVQSLPEPPSTPARGDWPEWMLQEFDHPEFLNEISEAQDWRYQQWERHCGSYQHRQAFLDALDLVCSRTIRTGQDLMLVPLLDMANHASRPQGGGYYKHDDANHSICLFVGERGVRAGSEITLDYGSRRNEEWLLHYGFLPDRNAAETVQLPGETPRVVSWEDVGTADASLQQDCLDYLEQQMETSLEEDFQRLRDGLRIDDIRLDFALNYRVSRKILLSAVAGRDKVASPSTSAFSSAFGLIEN
jgi:hypothetical protein